MARPRVDTEWTVLPHRPMEQLEENLWRVEGDLPNMPLKRVMTLVRRADGRLVIHNAVALDEAAMRALDALGEIALVVVPNGWHRLDAGRYAARYPGARFVAPSGARARVEEVVPVAFTYGDAPADVTVEFEELDGTRGQEGVMRVRSGPRVTLVFNDALFNMPHLPGVQGFVLRHVTASTGGPRVTRVARAMLLKDKGAFRAHLERLAAPEVARVVVSHHEVVDRDAPGTLRAVAATL